MTFLTCDELEKIILGTHIPQWPAHRLGPCTGGVPVDAYRDYVLVQIEMVVERAVISSFDERKQRIPDLTQDPTGHVVYRGGELAPGCREFCLKGRNLAIRQSSSCNLKCLFCYYKANTMEAPLPPDLYGIGDGYYELDTLKLMVHRQPIQDKGISWVYFEPFCDEEKLYPAMEIFRDAGMYQYLYTNGTLVNKEKLRRLADSGLNEIRFNLAATDCSDSVIDHIADAAKIIDHVCIESPAYEHFILRFMDKRSKILSTGVQYIHLAELQLTEAGVNSGWWDREGAIYRHKRSYVSPVRSRHFIYDVFEVSAAENWPGVTVYACSNDVKLYRGVRPDGNFEYHGVTSLPVEFYLDALRRYDLADKIRRY
jgi:pyruvate formate-lyase activating enzyme-like uncharacterized protein